MKKILLTMLLFLSFSYASISENIKYLAENKSFTCESSVCYTCLGERSYTQCAIQPNRGFIELKNDSYIAFGRGGFAYEACEVLAENFFNDLDISDDYFKAREDLTSEAEMHVKTYSSDAYEMTVHQFLTAETANKTSKRLVDVMQCSILKK